MRFKIEYLRDLAEELSVCEVQHVDLPSLEEARLTAQTFAAVLRQEFAAEGFQIRDADDELERVLCVEAFL